jgi:hypothetical protein
MLVKTVTKLFLTQPPCHTPDDQSTVQIRSLTIFQINHQPINHQPINQL